LTVVANIKLKGVPTLIGDTLLTTTEPGAISIEVPTNKLVTTALTRPVSRFARKVYIIAKRCCIAWAGSRLEAQRLIPEMRAHLRRHGVKDSSLAEVLSSQSGGQSGLTIVGWIADPEPRPFWWSNQDPKKVWFDEHDVEGLGEETFRRIFFAASRSGTGGGLTTVELASTAALAGIGRLLTEETLSGLSLQNGFGFCYDVAVWAGYRFKYVPSYTQVNYDVLFNENDRTMQIFPRSPLMIYNSIGQSAAFCVTEFGQKENQDGSRDLFGVEPILVPPLWGTPDAVPKTLAFKSRYICIYLRIADKQGNIINAPMCVTNEITEGDGVYFTKHGTLDVMNIKTDVISHLYDEAMKMKQEGVSEPDQLPEKLPE
jgi:hypothetical protein